MTAPGSDGPRFPPHFTLAELSYSAEANQHGIDNTPPPDVVANLEFLATEILEPARALLGVPLTIDDGYRSPVVNALDGGVAHSQHVLGLAADFRPVRAYTLEGAFNALRGPGGVHVPFDQLILESGCIHISAAAPGESPRRECLIRSGQPGAWRYTRVTDGRVS